MRMGPAIAITFDEFKRTEPSHLHLDAWIKTGFSWPFARLRSRRHRSVKKLPPLCRIVFTRIKALLQPEQEAVVAALRDLSPEPLVAILRPLGDRAFGGFRNPAARINLRPRRVHQTLAGCRPAECHFSRQPYWRA